MPQKADSQKLSEMMGQPVEITINDGESLEQAEARVMNEHPDVFKTQDFGAEHAGPDPQQAAPAPGLPQEYKDMASRAAQSGDPKAMKMAKDAITLYNSANPIAKQTAAKELPSTMQGDINFLKDVLSNNEKVVALKNNGFNGEGIDTGPLVGGGIPIPFTDKEIPFYPAGLSEFYNKKKGYGESSSDRALLRQEEKQLFNPKKKQVSGTASSDSERFVDLLPMVPNESDNDQAFFKKSLQLQDATQKHLLEILQTAQQSGQDVSGFSDVLNTQPEDAVNRILEKLTQKPGSQFFRELPDTAASFLSKKLKNPGAEDVIDLSQFRRK